ncbi:hypothetical protein ACLB2K_056744 [Fragaria x ananassa]
MLQTSNRNLLRSGVAAALAGRTVNKVLRRILRCHHVDLKHQILAAGPDSGDGPPLVESVVDTDIVCGDQRLLVA